MSSLSGKSDKEISQLLDEYGIKHGPIVESTRKLYEKKLNEAMTKKAKPSSSDKTYYREEQEEVEYISYHQPPQLSIYDGSGDVTRRSKVTGADFAHDIRRSKLTDYRDEDIGYNNEPIISPARSSYQSSSRPGPSVSTSMQRGQSSPETSKSGGVPGWLVSCCFLSLLFLFIMCTRVWSLQRRSPLKAFSRGTVRCFKCSLAPN